MIQFKVGDRVVLVRPDAVEAALGGPNAGAEGVVESADASAVRVRMKNGRLFWCDHDQLYHAPQVAPTVDTTLRERRERIATAVLAGLAASPGEVGYLPSYAKAAVEWADALIKELDK